MIRNPNQLQVGNIFLFSKLVPNIAKSIQILYDLLYLIEINDFQSCFYWKFGLSMISI